MTSKRFIEEHFPVKEVGVESSRDKRMTHGYISTLHTWWARRPLAASRATIYASLIPIPSDMKEISTIKHTIVELSRWSNPLDPEITRRAKKAILDYNKTPPKVLDLFAGGGSIPLEALRLGCETYATDYNPVSILLVKAAIEIPFQKNPTTVNDSVEFGVKVDSKLSNSVKKWSQWVFDEAKKELLEYFPNKEKNDVIGYMWSRSIPCQNPRCGADVPLIKQFWLARSEKRKIILFPTIKGKKVTFKVVGNMGEKLPQGFDPANGTVSRGKARCLVCNYRMSPNQVKDLFAQKKNNEIMISVVSKSSNKIGKLYSIPTKKDLEVFVNATKTIELKVATLKTKYNIIAIPYETLPPSGTLGFRVQRYGMKTWGDLFNYRQKLVLITLLEKILEATEKMKKGDKCDLQALPYIAIIFDQLIGKDATLCRWDVTREQVKGVFGRQALPMVWDYHEINPFTSTGWPNIENKVIHVLEHLKSMDVHSAVVKQASATSLPFENEFFDAVITDPPYYDNVPYSHLSDFFYVWLKRTLGEQFPSLFSTPLSPKNDEVVAYSTAGGYNKGKKIFEDRLKKSFSEIYRVLKEDGICIIVYAHKSTDGWETLINSILGAGLVVTAAWPIHTEMKERLRSKKSAALLSSIYMVCKKSHKKKVGFYRDVKADLKSYLGKKLDQLWGEGISGADFFIASIGAAIEVYGKYDYVMDNTDTKVPVKRLLEDTRTIVTDYAIDKVVHGEFAGNVSSMTRFYILWRWSHGEARVPFDDARKLAQSLGIDITYEWGKGFIRKDKEFVRVLGPDERDLESMLESTEMIDILHCALLMWKSQKIDEVAQFLTRKDQKNSEVLRRVAQAISESLSGNKGSKEKEWIDGMFTGSTAASDLLASGQTRLNNRG